MVLGPSSDPGLGGVPLNTGYASHTLSDLAPGSPSVLVGPTTVDDTSKGLKVAAIVASSLVLVVLVALVFVVVASGRSSPPPSTTQLSQADSIASQTTPASNPAAAGAASVSVSVGSPTVTSGEAVSLPVLFNGDPSQVESTTLVMNGLPTPDTARGLRNQFSFPTSFPGTVQLKVSIRLKDGRMIESNTVSVTVVPTTTVAPSTVIVRPSPTSGGSTSGVPFGHWVSMLGAKPSYEIASELSTEIPGSTVAHSDDIASLRPGYWVVFMGSFSGADDALANCRSLGRYSRDDCYAAFLSTNPADITKVKYP